MKNKDFLTAYEQTGRFSFGHPRNITITQDGKKALFLRANSSRSAAHSLYELDIESGKETILIQVNNKREQEYSEAEARLRERLREQAAGISSYSTDKTGKIVACISGYLQLLYYVEQKKLIELNLGDAVSELSISPDGKKIAYLKGGAVWCYALTDKTNREIVKPEKDIKWGEPDFIAAEELSRYEGLWWAPDSQRLLIERTDESEVVEVYISNPAGFSDKPKKITYPFAGTKNAKVSLEVFDISGQQLGSISWDTSQFEYLKSAAWSEGFIVLQVLSRSQKEAEIQLFDQVTYKRKKRVVVKKSPWIRFIAGLPLLFNDQLVTGESFDNKSEIYVEEKKYTLRKLILTSVYGISGDSLYFGASPVGAPEEKNIYSLDLKTGIVALSHEGGYWLASLQSGHLVTVNFNNTELTKHTVIYSLDSGKARELQSTAETPVSSSQIFFHQLGKSKLSTAVIVPRNYKSNSKLPVIMSPYGGPNHQEVIAAKGSFAVNQWLADQGFAVIVCDGRGTPGRGAAWEYAIRGNLASGILEDQITALNESKKLYPMLDLTRVGIRGWSFGGYLSILALLLKPTVFKSAFSGAPVTEWRLYDTGYTERYLGIPDKQVKAYDHSSLLKKAHKLNRPLALTHGFLDDNVLVSHSLLFMDAAFRAGKAPWITFIPLNGQTHLGVGDNTVSTLLKSEAEFFKRTL